MKKNIALVTGGYSNEAVISYRSGANFYNNLDRDLYNVYYIDVRQEGWFYKPDQGEEIPVDKNDFSVTIDGAKIKFDAAFIGMHGTPGEDGKLQGYFDMLGIPYTGCDAATSAITFNKFYAVSIAKMAGIAVAKSVHLIKGAAYDVNAILAELPLPLFVKPCSSGSSIGMSKVNKGEDLGASIEKAFKEDNQVLIESMVHGDEYTVGVFKSKGEITVLPLTSVKADEDVPFFDFEAKYEGKSVEVTPAVVDESIANTIREAAKKVYTVFNCGGVIRIDFIYNHETGTPYMLEANTIPGQSAASVVPQQVRASGLDLKTFYSKIVEECFA